MPYIPHTEHDTKQMLEYMNIDSVQQLFDEVPDNLLVDELKNTPTGVSEMIAHATLEKRATKDDGQQCFIGAGAYEHFSPALMMDIMSRGEFLTAYTPYQAEASQGSLQLVYEFQSMMASLTGMDVSNASMYDGASALSEALLMAVRSSKKNKSKRFLFASTVNPTYAHVCESIVNGQSISIAQVPCSNESGTISVDMLEASLKDSEEGACALVIQQPNFYGSLEDVNTLTNWAHANGMMVIAVANPISLGLLEAPGNWGDKGADICVGEGQSLGLPLSSGGPYFGFITCKQPYVRQMPGRIIGKTTDTNGQEGYVLTLQAREQHIRRSKATSNICTNQGLMVVGATVYMSLMGAEGIANVANASYNNMQHLKQCVQQAEALQLAFNSVSFHETVIELGVDAQLVAERLANDNIQAGYALGNVDARRKSQLLVCTTETKTEQDITAFIARLNEVVAEMQKEGF